MKIALCGNPNVGKTTVFNRITNSSAPVGNWHGVTVDIKTKRLRSGDTFTDLPGAYSLTARTPEECITRDEALYGDYDVLVCVSEVNNLRRNLYFLVQLLEAGKRTVLLVNMMDEARGKVNLKLLSERLNVPVVGSSERWKNPRDEILAAARRALSAPPPALPYAESISFSVASSARRAGLNPKYAALKAVELDEYVIEKMGGVCDSCGAVCGGFTDRDSPAAMRYAYIDRVLHGVIEQKNGYEKTDKIDKAALGKFALPIFLLVMTAVFVITFEAGRPLSDLIGRGIGALAELASRATLPDWVRSLLSDGIISGVGGVLGFLPQVTILFILTAILQDSGYMSRVAFLTDGFFRRFGLSGRAAFSLVLGLGCSVTAVLSTRGIKGEARRRAAFVAPFCPCSARLAVFTAVAAYFSLPSIAVAALYVIGLSAALVVLKIMAVIKKDSGEDSLLMEMPPYRIPSLKRVIKSTLVNIGSFVGRVGSVILGVSVIMWVLCNFSVAYGFTGGIESSIMSTVAGFIAPIFSPLGFGNWKAVTALISGVAAKETVVSVISALGGIGEVIGGPAEAFSFLIFVCLYVPCVATVAAVHKECGVKLAALSVLIQTVVAYIAALVFYGASKLYVFDMRLFFTVAACLAVVVAATVIVSRIVRVKKMHAQSR
ncbi:MAG: ferrous iron transport protein B [Clostridiales bacterium]|nr:ferrous iron transport protein B [Clostridiales bacterium]